MADQSACDRSPKEIKAPRGILHRRGRNTTVQLLRHLSSEPLPWRLSFSVAGGCVLDLFTGNKKQEDLTQTDTVVSSLLGYLLVDSWGTFKSRRQGFKAQGKPQDCRTKGSLSMVSFRLLECRKPDLGGRGCLLTYSGMKETYCTCPHVAREKESQSACSNLLESQRHRMVDQCIHMTLSSLPCLFIFHPSSISSLHLPDPLQYTKHPLPSHSKAASSRFTSPRDIIR